MMHFGNCVGCVGVGADVVAAAEAGVVGTVQCAWRPQFVDKTITFSNNTTPN